MVVCSPEVDDENLPLESETRYGCGFGPFCKKGALLVMAIPSERLPG
ncbi:Uncharacterised protein [Escherichia coli]|uniref:Uncharacterized protein n=1 Tax=Escherichia coli TaxID=562 RepID=A0A376KXN0_ECOLX|nr:Uncharacterised protein [Escherichia coli]